jgi:pyruvate-ferredoxin/flavodoxin oxidoreductase
VAEGKNPFSLDSKEPSIPMRNYDYNETRYKMLTKTYPETAAKLMGQAQEDVNEKWEYYSGLANSKEDAE